MISDKDEKKVAKVTEAFLKMRKLDLAWIELEKWSCADEGKFLSE